jgi:SPP1 gp7 family putative phage head morphogenesis protein
MPLPDYDPNILATALNMTPANAIAYLERKGFQITWDWTETLNEANNKVFQVAKSMRMDILQDIRNEVEKAVRDGVTFNQFRANLEPLLVQKGWWGRKLVEGPRGGQVVQLGSPWRLKTIYSTNTQSAYNAGRWKGQKANKNRRPYLMLIEILDQKTRSTHRSRSESIAHIDSSFWKSPNSWYPPNGFGCRGRVRALTEAQAKKRGIGLNGSGNPDPGFGGNPGITIWKPKKKDYDPDIWEQGERLDDANSRQS